MVVADLPHYLYYCNSAVTVACWLVPPNVDQLIGEEGSGTNIIHEKAGHVRISATTSSRTARVAFGVHGASEAKSPDSSRVAGTGPAIPALLNRMSPKSCSHRTVAHGSG